VEVVVASPGVPPVVRAFAHRGGGLGEVARSILAGFDGRKAIVFANSRSDVEDLTVHLRRHVDGQAIQVVPHHGSLSAGIRHQAEAALRNSPGRVIAVATSSLELGLDIGEVDLVAQVGVPPSPSTLAQRLGRSGRREAPAHLHLHVHRPDGQGPTAALRPGLVQSVATLELVLEGELERGVEPMHGSTFVHQLLSMASSPGAGEGEVKDLLSRAFPLVAPADAAEVLRSVEERGLVWREGGRLGLTEAGAAVVGRFTFYAAFQASAAYRVVWSGGEVGKLEGPPPQPGDRFALGGRAWLTLALHHGRRLVEVRPDDSGEPPWFLGSGIPVGDEVRRRMLDVYQGTEAPGWLDATASDELGEARTAFTRLGLDRTRMVADGPDVFLFPWRGDRVVRTIQRALALHGFRARAFDMCVVVRTERPGRVVQALVGLVRSGLPSPEALAPGGGRGEKFDRHLPPGVLARDRASRHLDIAGAAQTLEEIVGFQTTSH
jgi:ATP-dependent Lhr-like helicase